MRIIGAQPYETIRELCHAIKDGNEEAIHEAAEYLARQVPENALLVPVPGRWGLATNTLLLSRETAILAQKKVTYANILKGNIRNSLYELKKAGQDISTIRLGIRRIPNSETILSQAQEDGRPIILVDNVVDTGTTAKACLKVIPDADLLAVGDAGNPNRLI
ncbi:MAG: hypothetical protein IJ241_00310 [Clostridia bacterium]|nr:hypothetical protein [Clostridia bacterium]